MAQIRQLSAIMFTDLVGYTALMANDEKRAFEVLNRSLIIHKSAIGEFRGNLIKELGDGILASFPTVSDALNASIKIQKQCNADGIKLRIGIHQGEVVVEKEDIFGDAVNVASRLQALGVAGSVLFSDKVADEIKNKAEFKVVALGRFELKNVSAPVEVFALGNDGFAVPRRSEIRRPGVAVSFSALLILLLAGYAALNYEKWLPAPEEKSIVVLPFKFVGSEVESKNQFLADAFQSEIINQLTYQKNLLVIASESANKAYQAGWGPAEMHQRLNVQYILSGSLQKDGDQLHMLTQLTDANTGAVIDSKTLDRKLGDYFSMQKEIALKVVRDVGLVVSKGLVNHRGTDNLKALELMRRTRQYSATSRSKQETDSLTSLLHRAIIEDSMYLNPLYGLVFYHFYRFDTGNDTVELEAGLDALNRMIRIDRNSVLTQNAQALYSYYVIKDYALAIQQLDEILRRVPYNATAVSRKGLAYRRWGKYQECFDTYASTAKMNPLFTGPGIYREVGQDLVQNGQTREALPFIKKLRGTSLIADYYFFSFNSAMLDGRPDLLDSLLIDADQSAHSRFGQDNQKDLRFSKEQIFSFYNRDYRNNLELFRIYDIRQAALDSAILLRLLGDTAASRASFLIARDRHLANMRRMRGSQQGNQAWIRFAISLAGLGEPGWKEEFARIKASATGIIYPFYYNGFITACLLADENKKALAMLKEWKEENVPYPLLNAYMGPFQLLLKDHPLLDPIRNEPGFEELWEGNHLKLKPLVVPKELRIQEP